MTLKEEVLGILQDVIFESRQSDPGVGIFAREDLSPARKEVMVEHAEKQRIAGLDEENKKLRAKLEAIQKYATDRGMKLLMKLATVEP